MIGLQILLICIGITVLAVIPLLIRGQGLIPGISRRIRGAELQIEVDEERIYTLEADMSRISTRIARIEGEMARIGEIPPEIAGNRPNPVESALNPPDGTDLADFAPQDFPFDPMDGRIPYIDLTWSPPEDDAPETILDPEDDDV